MKKSRFRISPAIDGGNAMDLVEAAAENRAKGKVAEKPVDSWESKEAWRERDYAKSRPVFHKTNASTLQ